jgi:hypothetical protein
MMGGPYTGKEPLFFGLRRSGFAELWVLGELLGLDASLKSNS